MCDEPTRTPVEHEEFLCAARDRNISEVKRLLEGNSSLVDCVEAGGYAALHFAAFNGDVTLIALLAEHKANMNLANYDGNTPLTMAAKGRQHAAMRELVAHGADVNYALESGATAAHYAASMGDVEGVRMLRSLGACVNVDGQTCTAGTLLHWACHRGDLACVGAMLYEFSIDINSRDKHGGTPLFTALFMDSVRVVQLLLEHGGDPNIVIPEDGTTPLHIAAEKGDAEAVRLLIAFGASATVADKDGDLPADIAKRSNHDNRAVLNELSKTLLPQEKRKEQALRFKEAGNKAFSAGENCKAERFYSLAIQNDPKAHVLFSNRAACRFNMGEFTLALLDAERCTTLASQWPRGFYRKAAALRALKRLHESRLVADKGLELDPQNKDLLLLKAALDKK